MARYEVGSIYKIETAKNTYYIRLYEGHDHAVYAPITSEPTLETFENTPYIMYFSCNSFPIKRDIWKKIISCKKTDFKLPITLARFANFLMVDCFEQKQLGGLNDGIYVSKGEFLEIIKRGEFENIFNAHESVELFLDKYYENYPLSYILDRDIIHLGNEETVRKNIAVLKENGFEVEKYTPAF